MAQSQALRASGASYPLDRRVSYAPRILIVEDDLWYAILLMGVLREPEPQTRGTRFEVDIAHNIDAALKFLQDDRIDIYLVDLKLEAAKDSGTESAEAGKGLVQKILAASNAGVIVHSSIPAETDAVPLISLGVDDYIEKPTNPELIRAKVLALWRRVQLVRPFFSGVFAHANRAFRIGDWYFMIGNRELRNDKGEIIRLSVTEHSFLRHLCTIEGHEIDRETFNIVVMGRPLAEKERRMDTFIYKLRSKLGESVEIYSRRDGTYKLITVQELFSPEYALPPA